MSPADHYRQIGRGEHRDPNAHFDAKAYLTAHPDVAAAGFDPLSHFMVHGLAQNYEGWRRAPDDDAAPAGTAPTAAAYRVPDDLTATASGPETILVVGSCLVENLVAEFARTRPVQGDFVLANFASRLPQAPPRGLDGYDLQIVQLPMRAILPDNSFAHLRYHRPDEYPALFAAAEQRLMMMLDAAMAWNKTSGLTTFVVNFLRPQQNPLGRLTPKNDLRNFAYFIDRLNERLAELVAGYANSYVLDFDEIAATIGRMHVQDDHLWMLSHNSTLSDYDHAHDQRRLHPPEPISRRSDLKIEAFFDAVQAEVAAMYRAIRQADAVKLVIVDLDDTLWRGVVAEEGDLSPTVYEGWPLGIIEALCFLKHRGIVLAIASKNDEAKIRAIWDPLLGGRLQLSDFAVIRINWNPKVDNVADILEQVNVLPSSVVFIDDNPVERAAVSAAFPGLRTLGADLYGIRRALLWSSETQGPPITDESGRRTEMIQAQVVREQSRKVLSREAFLATLAIRIVPVTITDAEHGRFRRAFELINKTNQFNTTGQRWTLEGMQAGFRQGLRLHAFEVADTFTDYGLVGVVVREGDALVQCVMSCRVIGLDVEAAMLAHAAAEAAGEGHARLSAVYIPTGRNDLCAGLYRDAGFREAGDRWVRDLS
ncbi:MULTISPECIES: HAD-IIIC family phosphatase [unclassified Methylobacterium]|uniref:HAD-IIIC family phosphatase n=1 Tax=unclassified Methylobacterium TaxID=2615210 RepID=UPI00164F3BE8|nr:MULTISPECIES: HAD-IIIC family phosphatase [unclassified Methylobacterium]